MKKTASSIVKRRALKTSGKSDSRKPVSYKGYSARIEFDPHDRIFFGEIAGIADIVTFHGGSVDELLHEFEVAVDGYLEMSVKLGRAPQRPHSGKMLLRVPPEVHAHAAMMAKAHGKSLNQWAAEALSKAH